MKRLLIILLAFTAFGCSFTSWAQSTDDPVLLTVAGASVTKSEFLNVYMKNNIKGDAMDRKSLEEYLDLYINFRLKVKEAEELGLDTAASFINELAGYRKQLAQPYLSDKMVDENLLQEAYERMKNDIRASHILIRVDKNATDEDTLAAYKKIINLRNRILKGEAFDAVAGEASEDPSARDREDQGGKGTTKGNGGDLGFFTVLDMIYPFETGAYNTPVGEISMPVRTDYGYHLIKVTDRKPAMGKVTVAHIFVSVPKDTPEDGLAQYKSKIDEAYSKLQAGEKWEDVVAAYSDDKGSATKGGQLPAFGVNRMVPEFITAIGDLKKAGDYTGVIKTIYGYHIIKLIDRKAPQAFEDEKAALKNRILRDARAQKSKNAVISRIKAEYGYKEYSKNVKLFYSVVDSTIFDGLWVLNYTKSLSKPVFVLAKKKYTQIDFANYLSKHQSKRPKADIPVYVNEKFNQFAEETCLAYEDGRLETKYPEFKALMKEYRDGILLFELTDEKVWSKAIKDTSGLQAFHEKHKNNYMWEERLDATIYTCADEGTANAARLLASMQDSLDLTINDILEKINNDSVQKLKITSKLYLRKENSMIDNIPWQKGITEKTKVDTNIVFIVVHGVVPPAPKTLKEAKGLITADYQNALEKQWIDDLRKKYAVSVNKDIFETLIKQ